MFESVLNTPLPKRRNLKTWVLRAYICQQQFRGDQQDKPKLHLKQTTLSGISANNFINGYFKCLFLFKQTTHLLRSKTLNYSPAVIQSFVKSWRPNVNTILLRAAFQLEPLLKCFMQTETSQENW